MMAFGREGVGDELWGREQLGGTRQHLRVGVAEDVHNAAVGGHVQIAPARRDAIGRV